MTSEKSGQTKGKRPVGPWTRIDSERERWVRLIVGDSAGDHAALVSFGAGDTWWRVYRADEPQRAHAEGDVDDIEAGKAAADSHLEAAGWTIGTVATSAADGHFTTNETTEWDELSKPEAGLRAAINRDRWLKMGLNGARYFEPGFAHSADRENYLLNEHERLTEVINGARQALDEAGAPTHTPHGRLLGLGGRVGAMFERSLAEPVKPATRPKVSGFHQRGAGGYVVDDHGQEVGGVWPEGKSGEWAWYARRALLPSLSAHDAATKDEAQAACLEVLRTWADIEGEQVQHVDTDTAGADYEAPKGEAEAARHAGALDAFSTVLGLVDRVALPAGMTPSCATGAQWMRVAEAIQRVSGGLPMSADEAAENPPVRCGTFRAHLVPEQQETVAEVKRAARVEALEETIAAWKRRVDDLKGEIRKARDILSGVDCEGDRLEDQASNAAGEIRRLREANGSAWGILKRTGVGGDSLEERAAAAACTITELRESVKRWKALAGEAPAPKAIEPAGPLSLVCAVGRAGDMMPLARGGAWADEALPRQAEAGLWMWTGSASKGRESGAWIFIGEWTALPLPVLPAAAPSPSLSLFGTLAAMVREAVGLEGYTDGSQTDTDVTVRNLREAWLAFLAAPDVRLAFGEAVTAAEKGIADDDARCANCGTVNCSSEECEEELA